VGTSGGSAKEAEAYEDAILHSGKEKLGVNLKIAKFIGRKDIERKDYILHMEEYEAEIISGVPKVPQSAKGMTQYQDWHWGVSFDLKNAAAKGSLCSQIFLGSVGEQW